MKKTLAAILAMVMLFAIAAACGTAEPAPVAQTPAETPAAPAADDPTPAPAPAADDPAPAPTPDTPSGPEEAFPGKIAVVTNDISQNEEEYRSAEFLQLKYGVDKVIHRVWPVNFTQEGEQMVSILSALAEDPEVNAIIINQAVGNTNAAIDAVRALRGNDVYIVSIHPAEDPGETASRADLVLNVNNFIGGEKMVLQAKALGADTFAHVSFPRHMGYVDLAERRDIIKEVSEREGMKFVDLTAPDPMDAGGMPASTMHILQDIPRQVELLGKNTAFFSTNCGMQIPLIEAVVDSGAIYPQPCCPSPYHGFPTALGVADKIPTGVFSPDTGEEIMDMRSLPEVIEATRAILNARGMSGRLSTWPVPGTMMFTVAGFEYAKEVLNGSVANDKNNIDINLLVAKSAEYIVEVVGESVDVDWQIWSLGGETFPNYFLGWIDYLTY